MYCRKHFVCKKIFCLLLASLLTVSAVSCAEKTLEEETVQTETNPSVSETEAETEPPYLDQLPETMDYGGLEIRFISADETRSIQLTEEDDMGDLVNDAYWRRSEALEDRLQVKVRLRKHTGYGGLSHAVNQFITAQSDEYDIICGHTRFNVSLAASQYLLNMHQYDIDSYVDISRPYWSKLYIENINYKDNLYWLSGDMTTYFIECIYAMFVNQGVWEDYYADQNIYDMVLEGHWTMDKLHELCEGTYVDLNGNGKADNDDAYGIVMQKGHTLNGMAFACDVQYTGIDEEGKYSVILNSEHTIGAFEKLHNMFYNTEYGRMLGNEEFDPVCVPMFTENRLLFCPYTFVFSGKEEVRNMESDFFVIPLPKYDEQQENYRVNQYDGVPIYGIPITVNTNNLPAIASTLETMCSMTSQIVIPVYYDMVLKNKYSRDEITAQMIDLIHDCITADFCFYWGDSVGGLMDFFYANIQNDSVTSQLKQKQRVWDKMLGRLLGKLNPEQ